jgi:hypothetical protein
VTAPAGQSPCSDCETGACPCGATCEGCDFTGDCSSCRGTGVVEGLPRSLNPHRTRGTTGKRWGKKSPMDPCIGCGREHRCDKGYYRMTPDQVLRKVMNTPRIRHWPRCAICCVPFNNTTSRWYLTACSRGRVTEGTFRKVA